MRVFYEVVHNFTYDNKNFVKSEVFTLIQMTSDLVIVGVVNHEHSIKYIFPMGVFDKNFKLCLN